MASRTSPVNLKVLASLVTDLAVLEARINRSEPDKTLLADAERTALGVFRLVVMGEIKKGEILVYQRTFGTPGTRPCEFGRSDVHNLQDSLRTRGKNYTVYFGKGSGKEKTVIAPESVGEYGTEAGNPENVKRVDYIRVEAIGSALAGWSCGRGHTRCGRVVRKSTGKSPSATHQTPMVCFS